MALSTMTVPIQTPSTWAQGLWRSGLQLDVCETYLVITHVSVSHWARKCNNLYHTSALLSSHIESATLPLRYELVSFPPVTPMNDTIF